jgi:hypothetical protein
MFPFLSRSVPSECFLEETPKKISVESSWSAQASAAAVPRHASEVRYLVVALEQRELYYLEEIADFPTTGSLSGVLEAVQIPVGPFSGLIV